MMIYFCGSIKGGRQDSLIYKELVAHLKTYGSVPTQDVGDVTMIDDRCPAGKEKWLLERNMVWFDECDAVVAEATQPSIGVGYELGCAKLKGKKTLVLFRPDNPSGYSLSCMITGSVDENYRLQYYSSVEEAKKYIDEFLNSLKLDCKEENK